MARIRTVKPEFWDSPGVETLSPWARLLFIAMWNWADDSGTGKAEARELMGFAFPRDETMTLAEFRGFLGEVRRGFGVTFYKARGRSFYNIPSWDRHQKIDKRSASRWPLPEEGVEYDPETNALVTDSEVGDSENPAETPPSVRGNPGAGTEEQRNRGTEEKEETSEIRSDVDALCSRLHERITANGAKATITKRWHDSARLLIDRDGRELDQALRLIDWATDHSFWSANVLSMPKFREKYDQLLIQARREHEQRASPNGRHATDENIARLMGTPLRALPGGQT